MFTGIVVDNNDPKKSGRLKIRIYGVHDDISRVPDDMLPWAKCKFPITNPASAGMAGPAVGAVKGTIVTGVFLDEDKQIPLIDGVLIKESTANPETQAASSNKEDTPDLPKAYGTEDFNSVLNENVFKMGSSDAKFAITKTIGSLKYNGEGIGKFLSDIGQGALSRALGQLSDVKNQIDQIKNLAQNATNIDDLGSILGSGISDLSSLSGSIQDTITTTVEGTIFNNVNHLTGFITDQSWGDTHLSEIKSVQDALNKIDGHSFVMGSVMTGIESSFAKIKSVFNV